MAKKTKRRKKKSSRHSGCLVLFVLLLMIILVPIIFMHVKLSSIHTATKNEVNEDEIIINDMNSSTESVLKGYRNIALFGVDTRDGELGTGTRSDSIIIASINETTKEVRLLSLYRDTCMNIPTVGREKATHAYFYGGPQLAMSMLNQNFDLDIIEFVTVDFSILTKLIDALGGLDIDITDEELTWINGLSAEQCENEGVHYTPLESSGYQHLNGVQATSYARIRKIDSDFKRAERQRKVLNLMLEKAKSANPIQLYFAVSNALPEIYTNLTKSDILSLGKDIFKYNLESQSGFPFDIAEDTFKDSSYVFADGFSYNVRQLHKYLFDEEYYVPSDKVEEINYVIYEETGY